MPLPFLVDEVRIKKWTPELKRPTNCYLYDFKSMGITPAQFADVIVGKKAMLFEKEILPRLRGFNCHWCSFKEARRKPYVKMTPRLQDHIFSHKDKNIVSYQVYNFQKELYSLRLSLVRDGWDESICFLVQHDCQFCLDPLAKGREGICAIPTSTRNRMRSLKRLSYPIKHLVVHPKRRFEWSILGIIVLIRS